MVDHDPADTTRQSASPSDQAPGGATSRGPDYGQPGEVQVPVMPYDDGRGEASAEGAEGVRKAYDATNAPAPGESPPVSDEERSGMSATEMHPEPPLGVGRSHGSRAEDLAPDRDDAGKKAGRPVGKVADDDSDSVGAKDSSDPRSPDLQAGAG